MKGFKAFIENMTTAAIASSINNPPGPKSRLMMVKRKKFNGCDVFVLDPKRYHNCRTAKLKTERFAKYLGDDEIGMAVREYARLNPSESIIIEDEMTGSMTYLKVGKNDPIGKYYGR